MLNPRYKNLSEMVGDFKSMLQHMDDTNPKDTTILKKEEVKAAPIQESRQDILPPLPKVKAEAARMSMYSSQKTAVESFRVLAGLEEREIMPWNPGILGTTKTDHQMMEDFGMSEDASAGGMPQKSQDLAMHIRHKPPQSSAYSPQKAYHALDHSDRTLRHHRVKHTYIKDLEVPHQMMMRAEFAKQSKHAADTLRSAADGAPSHIAAQLHSLADKHDRHHKIYSKGNSPKMESIDSALHICEMIDIEG